MSLKSIPKGVLAVATVVLLICAFFGYGIVNANSENEAITNQLVKLQKKAKEQQNVASATSDSGLNLELARAQVMNQFTNQVASATSTAGVKLSQLQFDPSLTKIAAQADSSASGGGAKKSGGWALNSVSFAIDGPTPQVFLAIRKIAEMSEPFGLSEVSINRVVNTGTGVQGVSASIRVALLVPSEGS